MVRARFKPGQAEAGRAGKAGLPRREWARLLSRLRSSATETNDYPGLAESQSVTGRVGLVTLVSLTSGRHSPRSGGRRPSPALGLTAVGGAPEARRAVRRAYGGRCAGSATGGAPEARRAVRRAYGGRCAGAWQAVWMGGMCLVPVTGTRRSHFAGIVIGRPGNITRTWSRNDPCGSCGGGRPRRSIVAKRFHGSAQQRRWARWEIVSISVSTTAWRLTRSSSMRRSSAP